MAGEEVLLTHLHTNIQSVTYEQYNVAIQNATFGLSSELPKLWTYEISFVSTRPVAKNASRNIPGTLRAFFKFLKKLFLVNS